MVSVACALSVTFFVVRRELSGNTPILRPRGIADYQPLPVEDWERLVSTGHRMGSATADFMILEFADFQCPACRLFSLTAIKPLRDQYPDDVAVVYRHWPLPYHPFAFAAAQASECAGAQGRFDAMHDTLFEHQDSIGRKPFDGFAREAGVPDSARFAACMAVPDSSVASSDARMVKSLGGVGTPTVLINGKLLSSVPDSAGLAAMYRQHVKARAK